MLRNPVNDINANGELVVKNTAAMKATMIEPRIRLLDILCLRFEFSLLIGFLSCFRIIRMMERFERTITNQAVTEMDITTDSSKSGIAVPGGVKIKCVAHVRGTVKFAPNLILSRIEALGS